MRTWEVHRKWCDEMLMGDSAEKALAVVVEVATRMVLEAMAGGIELLRFYLMCLDHIAVGGLEDDAAAEATDGSVLVTTITEEKMEAMEGAMGSASRSPCNPCRARTHPALRRARHRRNGRHW